MNWHEPKHPPHVYWDLWEGTQDPYALLAWGRSLDRECPIGKWPCRCFNCLRKEKVV